MDKKESKPTKSTPARKRFPRTHVDLSEFKGAGKDMIKRRDRIEKLIEKRIKELKTINKKLQREIAKHRRTEDSLRSALSETKQHQAEISALLEGIRTVLESRDFYDTAKSIFDTCKKIIGATAGYVALVSEDGTRNEVTFLDSGGLPCTVDPNLPMPIRGLREIGCRAGKTVYHNDFSNSEFVKLMPQGHVHLDNVLFAPLKIKAKVVGLLGLANKQGGFTEEDVRIASGFGELAAIALCNKWNEEFLMKVRDSLEIQVQERTAELTEANEALQSAIEEHKRMTEALQESEERFRTVADFTYDWEYWITPDRGYIYVSPSCERVTGYSPEEFLRDPKLLETITHPDDKDVITRHISEYSESEKVGSLDFRIITRSGEERWISHRCQSVRSKEGAFIGRRASNRDITERMKTGEALRKSEARLAEAQRIAHLGNWEWDIRKNKLYWSDEIYRIFGLTPQQFGATYDAFLSYVHPEDRDFVKKAVNDALCGKPYSIDHRIVLPDGTVRFVHEQGEVTFVESGEPIRMLGTVQDITEKKETEMQLIMSERLSALGQMASGIAHEINNPLATIAGCTEGLLNRINKGRYDYELFKNYLKIIEEEVERCKKITVSMLSFVRKGTYEKDYVNINEILDKTLELIGLQGRLKEIEIVRIYNRELPLIEESEGELRQAFLAIITNSLDAMQDRGVLTLETGIENDAVFINISDTGLGMPPELIGKIFDPFFTTKSEKGGVGLGLSIAHKIITDNRGKIEVASDKVRGTTFKIILTP